ncbi:hypothetical protein PIB30_082475 [Stylosanthes scabra]|uniref:Uncharacterized protein n=1 Tax=Stylosanthes scabra TaxID=79078 RepID=A0ABU6WRR6_9FABA|nr:hypothetical protein [Stylosanthes scabra]
MVDASAGGALMNKMPEEAWELIESMADNNQHFKEIKEGQAVTPKPLTQHANTSQQVSVKHCGICSCNSHYTDECPKLQEDHTIAASHNFYENQQSPPNNRQYYTQPQGWRDNQQNRWNSPQQSQQTQLR